MLFVWFIFCWLVLESISFNENVTRNDEEILCVSVCVLCFLPLLAYFICFFMRVLLALFFLSAILLPYLLSLFLFHYYFLSFLSLNMLVTPCDLKK